MPVGVRIEPCRASVTKLTGSMHVGLDENVHSANAVELYLLVLVLTPVTHAGHILPSRIILLVPFCQDNVLIQRFCQTPALI